MKKKLRSILALLMAILMVAACTACGSGGNGGTASGSSKLQEVLDRGYLIVGTGSTNAPWHFYDDNGNLCGFDVSMAKIVANSLFGDPEKVKFVEQSSDERVPNLVNGNVDICFQFMTISAERAQQIEFTIPYYTEGCEALLHTNSKYKTGEQLLAAMDSGTKVTVAILQNSFAEDIVAYVFAGHDNYTVDQYEDQALLYQALASGRCARRGSVWFAAVSLPLAAAGCTIGLFPSCWGLLLLAGGMTALLGEFLCQVMMYGLMPTTILWLLPPVARGLVIGGAARFFWKSGCLLESRPVTCYVVCLVGSFATSCVTTVCLWLDSLIYDYFSFAFVFGSALIRFGKDIVIVAIVTTIVIPLMKLLRRGGLVPVLN